MTGKKSGWKRARLSIRFKMLLVISTVLLVAIGTYLYLATSLFTDDKLAYIYDLNSSLVGSLSEQTSSTLRVLVKEAGMYRRDVGRPRLKPRERRLLNAELFTREPDFLRVEVFSGVGEEGSYLGRTVALNQAGLDEIGISSEDLDLSRRDRPLPLSEVAKQKSYLYIHNSSLPPDAAILTIAFRSGENEVLAVDFNHERLLRIFGESKLREAFLVDERGVVIAHPTAKMVINAVDRSANPLVKQALSGEVEQGVREFRDPDTRVEYLGAYARVGLGRLWVLTQIPREQALAASRVLIERSVLFAIAILLASFLVSIFFSRYLAAPIRKLSAATERIGRGDFNVDIDVRSRDEIGDLAEAFSRMGAALKQTQAQLVQSEKMAAFGQLGAGITHEVKNPMTGIVGFAQLAQRKVEDKDKTLELLKLIEKEGLRCRDILVNFLKFARTSEGEQELISLNRLVEETAGLLRHQLNMNRVKIDVQFDEHTPKIMGSQPELQQVLMNLGINAQQAMAGAPGKVTFQTSLQDGNAVVKVIDTGPGIPEEIRVKIFEPFFTTKEKGEGTGLGLSVSFGIIRNHNGVMEVASEIGNGTTFTIRIPSAEDNRAVARSA